MNIHDYLPSYPDLQDPKFNEQILQKKEFYDLRTTEQVQTLTDRGDLWNNQKLIARFLSPHTFYQELLLFGKVGVGKTCSAIATSEFNLNTVKVPVIIIVPNDDLVYQWKQQIALTCTRGQYIPENYFNTENPLTRGEKIARINKLLDPYYLITTVEKFHKIIDSLPNESIIKKYNDSLIIVDEAHQLRIQTKTSKKQKALSITQYKSYHRFFHLINSKKLLITGTPMVDNSNELAAIMNLILPMNKQLPTGSDFTKKFEKTNNDSELLSYLVGRVAYIREGGEFPVRQDLGENKWTKYIKTKLVNVSDFQLQGIKLAYAKDTEKGDKKDVGLWRNSRQAANFVYGTTDSQGNVKYMWGDEAFKYLTEKGKEKEIVIDKTKIKYTPVFIKHQFRNDIKTNLAKYSAKFYELVTSLINNPTKPQFFFTPLVNGAGGAIFLGCILEVFDFAQALGVSSKPLTRYAIITGEKRSGVQRNKLLELFNLKENRDGSIIKALIGTSTLGVGVNLLNVQEEQVISPYWNNSTTEQAIGRGFRSNSLSFLPKKDKIIQVAQLAINSDKLAPEENIDAHLYIMSEKKDINIKKNERMLQRAAFDCALNYDRNVRETDQDYSRACEYQKCNYVCYQTTPNKSSPKYMYNVPIQDIIEDTYLLYYKDVEMLEIVGKIQQLMRKFTLINIDNIYKELKLESFKLLVLTIEYIIENNINLYNKWGQPCFLRRYNNILYLSSSLYESDLLVSWYTRYMYVNSIISLDRIITDEIYEKDKDIFSQIDLNSPEESKELIKKLDPNTQIFILERIMKIDADILPSEELQKKLEILIDMFADHIFIVDKTRVHDLEKIKSGEENYIDTTKGEYGYLRCLKDGEEDWKNCGKKETDVIAKKISDIKDTINKDVINNEYNVYAILEGNEFKIVNKKLQQQDTEDRRKIITGRVCTSLPKEQIIDIINRINLDIEIPEDTPTSKNELLKKIKGKVAGLINKKSTLDYIQKIYVLNNMTREDMCEKMKQWFIDNDLIINKD